jgi:hypothetical protein
MKHVRFVSRRPGKADDAPPIDIDFIIDIITAFMTKKLSYTT